MLKEAFDAVLFGRNLCSLCRLRSHVSPAHSVKTDGVSSSNTLLICHTYTKLPNYTRIHKLTYKIPPIQDGGLTPYFLVIRLFTLR